MTTTTSRRQTAPRTRAEGESIFRKTAKQIIAIRLMAKAIEVLLEGGSRSGKTFIAIYAIVVRSLKHPNSRHLIVRRHSAHLTASVWSQTFPKVCKICFPGLTYTTNQKDMFITFPNGSQIWFAGTDDKERIEKLLGQEWDTIYMNEASQMPFSTYETLKTRLNPQKGIKPLFLIDYNPPSKRHWGYVMFHEGLNYETKQPLTDDERYASLQMNPSDNVENLSDGYIATLESMSESKRRRFLLGEYSDDTERALFKREWIIANRLPERPRDVLRVVVAIDPNVTDDKKADDSTDEAGIVTVGQYKIGGDFHYFIAADDSTPGLSWGGKGVEVFRREGADKIIAEVNQGGDLVQMNIRNHDREIADRHYESVRATRGKEIRAEPVADLYRLGFVHHIGEFPDLENELCSWIPGEGRSPNRLDAMVWGVSYLSGDYMKQASVFKNTFMR